MEKAFVGKKPQTTVTATATGRGAFARHVAKLQEIIAGRQGKLSVNRYSSCGPFFFQFLVAWLDLWPDFL